MKIMKIFSAALMAAACLAVTCFPAAAATKISSVSVKFESEGYDDEGIPEVFATTSGTHYTVDNVYSAYYDTESDTAYDFGTDIYVVLLTAEDGYYFASNHSKDIHLSGLGAKLTGGTRENDKTMLRLYVQLPKAYDTVNEIERAWWGDNGRGNWEEAFGARSYLVSISDGKGKSNQAETFGTTYDFRPFMQKEGDYTFKVKPVSATDKKGDWVESGSFHVSAEAAAANEAAYKVDVDVAYKDGVALPGNAIYTYKNIGWQTTEDGRYWYRNQDGSYPQDTWLSENGSWYYFGSDGYMIANAYHTVTGNDYYFGADGRMVVSGTTPDGRTAGADGVLTKK